MKFGIIGTGRITDRFMSEAKTVKGVEILVACNPNLESAKRFADQYNLPFYTDKAEELPEVVDAVYIAAPHQTHYTYTKQMLEAGVHVLCEKPMTLSKNEAKELYELADAKSCVLMEAIKTAYCPGFLGMLEIVKSGKIGKVCDVESCFSRLTPTNLREMNDVDCGGSFTEFASYSLLPIVKFLGTDYSDVRFQSLLGANGIDVYTKAFFDYGTAAAMAKTGLGVKSEGQLVISGTKGYILAESPWWLTRKFEVRYEDPNKRELYECEYEAAGLRYEIQMFVERIKTGESVSKMQFGLSEEESIWLAGVMETFLAQRKREDAIKEETDKVGIWAHRGCSMAYPENTLEAFTAAAKIKGIAGIELDVQLTKDRELVVIHDETVDRTTNGTGRVCEYTLEELKKLEIASVDGQVTRIPTLEEVFEALQSFCKKDGLLINIELKNSRIRYEGMEELVLALVKKYELEQNIVYSSFLAESMGLMKQLCPTAQTGILGGSMQQCIENAKRMNADALHPWIGGFDISLEERQKIGKMPIRAWNGEEPFFGQDRQLKEKNSKKYAAFGATDIITNVPELYLKN